MDKKKQRFGGRGTRGEIGQAIEDGRHDPSPAVPATVVADVNQHKPLSPIGASRDERRGVMSFVEDMKALRDGEYIPMRFQPHGVRHLRPNVS